MLPANYGKAAEFRHLPAAEVVAATTGRDVDRLTPRTVQRHLAALSSLWERAVEAGELKENLFSNLKLPKAKKAQEQRGMWTPDKLGLLFDTPIWRGCQSQARRSKAGHCVFRDEKFWLPLIALFSGMRQEEICQLHVDDVRQESGVWVFDINNRPPRQVKNRNAVRLVPIHCQLAEMGFLEYVAEQRSASRTSLFHQLNPGGADQRFGHNFTKWFTRYRRDVGLYEKGVDFHSFRHSATTFMQWAEVPVSIIDALTGHATSGETARYTKNFQISQLRQAVDAIDSRIDLSHLKA
jgi:integrase